MAATFKPAEWLASFESIGGGFAFTGERLHLWIVPRGQTDQEISLARALVVDMGPDNRKLLAEHLQSVELVGG
jgi:hypothetical protein